MVNQLRNIFFFLLCFISTTASAQQTKNTAKAQSGQSQPKLVVGLVIDQMRWDYLYRYNNLYGNNGFKRLMREGFSCDNTMITHLPTYTAVGHAGIYTGSYPAIHGIVGNDWIESSTGKSMYCVSDSTVSGLGTDNDLGKMSPRNMQAHSIADELRLSTNFQSKVIGISLKDRGAILPAGHSANAAYWFDDKKGNWISSTYYMASLPEWVNQFNALKLPESYAARNWSLLKDPSVYTQSTADAVPYEGMISGEKSNTFPHQFNLEKDKRFSALKFSPFGNILTLDFARAVVKNEMLGKGSVTDFLTVSLSSTDYVGHVFGPNSMEIEDIYLRLDLELAGFFSFLDSCYGRNNYLLFLTADHGVANNPDFLNSKKLPGGKFDSKMLVREINDSLERNFNIKGAISFFDNYQLYFSREFNQSQQVNSNRAAIYDYVKSLLSKKEFVLKVYDLNRISESVLPDAFRQMSSNSYFASRSGDIQIISRPNYFDGQKTGTTHGCWNPYDAHIPLLWMGKNIKPGRTHREVHMTDIAATLAALLDIQMPNGCVGKVIEEVVR